MPFSFPIKSDGQTICWTCSTDSPGCAEVASHYQTSDTESFPAQGNLNHLEQVPLWGQSFPGASSQPGTCIEQRVLSARLNPAHSCITVGKWR